ncbi:hypothetical protein PsAD2_01243 [Pseudovibrio axinellae]|uniref:Uncharacterized protein n=1 Tax=Pseudovibrio axinellae TaxID=989403 RepID=A0A161XG26_9HYPH|nr:hypothetical protein PsAD2_01243 [Pseudovibrio axinellae]SER23636.1 hypothetical protein SAMN05421798_107134 [Pseudovibrio axinellae]
MKHGLCVTGPPIRSFLRFIIPLWRVHCDMPHVTHLGENVAALGARLHSSLLRCVDLLGGSPGRCLPNYHQRIRDNKDSTPVLFRDANMADLEVQSKSVSERLYFYSSNLIRSFVALAIKTQVRCNNISTIHASVRMTFLFHDFSRAKITCV